MATSSGVSIGEIYGRLFLVDDLSPGLQTAANNLGQFNARSVQFAASLNQVNQVAGGVGRNVATASAGLNSLAGGFNAASQAARGATGSFGGAGGAAGGAGGQARGAAGGFESFGLALFGATTAGNLAADAIKSVARSMVEAVTEVGKLAARVEMLQGVSAFMARQQGYTADQTKLLANSLKLQGITTQQAHDTIAQLVRVNIDLSRATQLATIAQNLARVANLNSSETLNRLVHGIVTLNSRVLHTIGLNVTLASAVKGAANETGKSIQQMSQAEKQQTLLNAVVRAASTVTGVYGETIGFVGGRLLSLERFQEEARVAIGTKFLGAMAVAVDGLTIFHRWVSQNADAVILLTGAVTVFAATMSGLAFAQWIGGLAALTGAFTRLRLTVIGFTTAGGLTGALATGGFVAAALLLVNGLRKVVDSFTGFSDAQLTWDETVVAWITGSTLAAQSFSNLKVIIGELMATVADFGKASFGVLFGDELKDFDFSKMFESLVKGISAPDLSWLTDWGSDILAYLDRLGGGILDWLDGLGSTITTGIGNAFNFAAIIPQALDAVAGFVDSLTDSLSIGSLGRNLAAGLPDGILKGILGFTTGALDSVREALDGVGEWFRSMAGEARSAIETLNGWIESIGEAFRDLTGPIDGYLDTIVGYLGDFGRSVANVVAEIRAELAKLFGEKPPEGQAQTLVGKMAVAVGAFLHGTGLPGTDMATVALARVAGRFERIQKAQEIADKKFEAALKQFNEASKKGLPVAKPERQRIVTQAQADAILSAYELTAGARFFLPPTGEGEKLSEEAFAAAGGHFMQTQETLHRLLMQNFSQGNTELQSKIAEQHRIWETLYGDLKVGAPNVDVLSKRLGQELDDSIRKMKESGESAKDIVTRMFNREPGEKGAFRGLFTEDALTTFIENRKEQLEDLAKAGDKAAEELRKANKDIADALAGPQDLKESTMDQILLLTEQGVNVDKIAKSLSIVTKESEDAIKAFAKVAESIVAEKFTFSAEQMAEVFRRSTGKVRDSAKDIAQSMGLPAAAVERLVENFGDLPTAVQASERFVKSMAADAKERAEQEARLLKEQAEGVMALADIQRQTQRELEIEYAIGLDRQLIALRHQKEDEIAQYDKLKATVPEIHKQIVTVIEGNYERLANKIKDFNEDIIEEARKLGFQTIGDLEARAESAKNTFEEMKRAMEPSGRGILFDPKFGVLLGQDMRKAFGPGELRKAWQKFWDEQQERQQQWGSRFRSVVQTVASEIAASASRMGQILGETGLGNLFRAIGQIAEATDLASKGADRMHLGFHLIKAGFLTEGFVNLAGGIMQAAAAFMQATDSASKFQRAMGGAMVGAQVGSLFGPIGAAIGAGIGAIMGIFRKPGWVDVMKRVGHDWGVAISQELAKSIEESAKNLFGGSRQAAEIFHLGDIISEAGGLNDLNLDKFVRKLRDVFSMVETGAFDAGQAMGILEENWNDFAEAGTDATGALADNLREILQLAQRFGLLTDAMRAYIRGEVERAQEGWNDVIAAGTEGFEKLTENIDKAKEEFDDAKEKMADFVESTREKFDDKMFDFGQKLVKELGKEGSDAASAMGELGLSLEDIQGLGPQQIFEKVNTALRNLTDEFARNRIGVLLFGDSYQDLVRDQQRAEEEGKKLQERLSSAGGILKDQIHAQQEAAKRNKQMLEDMGIVAVGMFGAALKSGKSFFEALETAAPGLKSLKKAYEDLGITADDAGLRALLLQESVLENTPALHRGIAGLSTAVTGLANVGMLSGTTLSGIQRTAMNLYTRLQGEIHNAAVEMGDFGDHTADALLPMQGYLHAILKEAEKLGLPLDAFTQDLIDQSRRLGIWQEQGETDIEKMERNFELLSDTIKGLARDISDAMGDVGSSIADSIGLLRDLINEFRNVPTQIDTTINVTQTGDPLPGGGGGAPGDDAGRAYQALGQAASAAASTIETAFDMQATPALERTRTAVNDVIQMQSPTGLEGIIHYAGLAAGALEGMAIGASRDLHALAVNTASVASGVGLIGDAAATDAGALLLTQMAQLTPPAALPTKDVGPLARVPGFSFTTASAARTATGGGGGAEEATPVKAKTPSGFGQPVIDRSALKLYLSGHVDLFKAAMAGSRSLLYTFARFRDVEMARQQALMTGETEGPGGSWLLRMLDHAFSASRDALLTGLNGGRPFTGLPVTTAMTAQEPGISAEEKLQIASKLMTAEKMQIADKLQIASKLGAGDQLKPVEVSVVSLKPAELGLTGPSALKTETVESAALGLLPPIDIPIPRVPLEPIIDRTTTGDGVKFPTDRLVDPDRNTTMPVPAFGSDIDPFYRFTDPPVPPQNNVIIIDGHGLTRDEAIEAALEASPSAWTLNRYGSREALLTIVRDASANLKRRR